MTARRDVTMMSSTRIAILGVVMAVGIAGAAPATTTTWQGISQNVANPEDGSSENYVVRFTFDDASPFIFNNYETVPEPGFSTELYNWAYYPNLTSFSITGPRFNVTIGDENGFVRVSTLRFARRQGGSTGFAARSGSDGTSAGYAFDFSYYLQNGFASSAIPGSLNITNAFENGFALSLFTAIEGTEEFESTEVLNFRFASGDFLPAAPSAVPEPASWAMMIAGFGVAGGLMRRRRRAPAFG